LKYQAEPIAASRVTVQGDRSSRKPGAANRPLIGGNVLTVKAYAATSATEPLSPATIDRRDVGPHDVLIEIRYCGICHSDIHFVRSEWDEVT
jgi:alcohol dehydrogenase (NADP+)